MVVYKYFHPEVKKHVLFKILLFYLNSLRVFVEVQNIRLTCNSSGIDLQELVCFICRERDIRTREMRNIGLKYYTIGLKYYTDDRIFT